MANVDSILKGVRLELGDLNEQFRDSFRGTGDKDDYDLPGRNIVDIDVFQVTEDQQIIPFTEDSDYTVDRANGVITFTEPPELDAQIVVEGSMNGMFTDAELQHYVDSALALHLHGRTVQRRYRDGRGFIKYDEQPMDVDSLPAGEEVLVTLLATIEALWALTTDAATDIDVQTAEGTSIPRGQRFRQLTAQVDLLTDKYESLSLAMGVGLFAPEVLQVRRVSRTTGRLVPIFKPREYDEHGPPIRKLAPRSNRDVDPDGPESPYWSGGWGF